MQRTRCACCAIGIGASVVTAVRSRLIAPTAVLTAALTARALTRARLHNPTPSFCFFWILGAMIAQRGPTLTLEGRSCEPSHMEPSRTNVARCCVRMQAVVTAYFPSHAGGCNHAPWPSTADPLTHENATNERKGNVRRGGGEIHGDSDIYRGSDMQSTKYL